MSFTPILYLVNVGSFGVMDPAFKKDANKAYAQEGFFLPPRVAAKGVNAEPAPTLSSVSGSGALTYGKSGGSILYAGGVAVGANAAYIPKPGA